MKVKDAKEIINMVKSFNFNSSMKSNRNNSMTILEEITIMEKSLENKKDEEPVSEGIKKSFERMKKQYEYLKDL